MDKPWPGEIGAGGWGIDWEDGWVKGVGETFSYQERGG